jgi:5S rRNA maturation endonuclease (ribonuclease M5)
MSEKQVIAQAIVVEGQRDITNVDPGSAHSQATKVAESWESVFLKKFDSDTMALCR